MFLDGVMKETRERLGMNGAGLWDTRRGQERKADFLLFADDSSLVADSEEGLWQLLRVFGYVCKKKKLKMNVSKRKVVRICGHSEENAVKVNLNGRKMEEVKTYRNLGIDILNDGRMSEEIDHWVGEAKKTDGTLMSLWKKEAYVLGSKSRQ